MLVKQEFSSENNDYESIDDRNYFLAIQDHTYGISRSLPSHDSLLNSGTSSNILSSPTAPRSASSIADLPFLHLEPPLSEDDYNFALEENEGIADLFDEYSLQNVG